MKFHPITVSRVHRETRDTIVAWLDVPAALQDEFVFKQGQHLTLNANVNGEDLRRSYSICSAVDDGELRVAIKRTTGGLFSTWANDTLKPGSVIKVMPPMGHFHLPLDASHGARRYLGVAAGSGITPLLSIIKTTLKAEPEAGFTLVYGNRSSSSVIFREELADLKDCYPTRLSIVHVMSREPQDIELFNGRITGEKIGRLLDTWIDLEYVDAAFVCGPEQMMRDVSKVLSDRGIPKESIKVELFAASAPKREHVAAARPIVGRNESVITVIADGAQCIFTMPKDKISVLDAGLAEGIEMRYSCKGGVCATCRCKVVEGQVDMDANYALEDYEIARGFVLSCQAFPVTDHVVLDFDQDS